MASGRASGSAVTPPPGERTRGDVEPGAAAAASASGSTRAGKSRSPPSGDNERAGPRQRRSSPPTASAFDHGAALGLPRPAAAAATVVAPSTAADAQAGRRAWAIELQRRRKAKKDHNRRASASRVSALHPETGAHLGYRSPLELRDNGRISLTFTFFAGFGGTALGAEAIGSPTTTLPTNRRSPK